MPDENKDKLRSMLDNLIDNKGEQAQVDFHDYMKDKMQSIIHGEEVPAEDLNDTEQTDD